MDLNLDDYSGDSRAILDAAIGNELRIGAFDRLSSFTHAMAKAAHDDQLAYRALGSASGVECAAVKLVSECKIASQVISDMGVRASQAERAIRDAMSHPIMETQRELERMYGPFNEILAMQREAQTLKAYTQAMEPANLFCDQSDALKMGASIHQSIAERSTQIALQSQIAQMRNGFDIPDQWSKLGVAGDWLAEERKLLDRFCDVASPELRIGAVGRLNGVWAQQESLARGYLDAIRAQAEITTAFTHGNFSSADLYGGRDWRDALSGLSVTGFSGRLNRTQVRHPRAKRPYFANRNMYELAANVGGAIEAVLRDAVNRVLVDEFGSEWISEQFPLKKIKSLLSMQESESRDGQSASLYEYLSLSDVVGLIRKRDLWDACIGELFSAPQEDVRAFLDQLTTRNVATHRRSNFCGIRMRDFFVAARFIATALKDDDLLGVIDEAEERAPAPSTVH